MSSVSCPERRPAWAATPPESRANDLTGGGSNSLVGSTVRVTTGCNVDVGIGGVDAATVGGALVADSAADGPLVIVGICVAGGVTAEGVSWVLALLAARDG